MDTNVGSNVEDGEFLPHCSQDGREAFKYDQLIAFVSACDEGLHADELVSEHGPRVAFVERLALDSRFELAGDQAVEQHLSQGERLSMGNSLTHDAEFRTARHLLPTQLGGQRATF